MLNGGFLNLPPAPALLPPSWLRHFEQEAAVLDIEKRRAIYTLLQDQ